MGTLHGGVLCDIADAAMGMAYASTLGEGETFTTIELKINFLKPVAPETSPSRPRRTSAQMFSLHPHTGGQNAAGPVVRCAALRLLDRGIDAVDRTGQHRK
jgi:uncharacterized protein (TIGR00369 family)